MRGINRLAAALAGIALAASVVSAQGQGQPQLAPPIGSACTTWR